MITRNNSKRGIRSTHHIVNPRLLLYHAILFGQYLNATKLAKLLSVRLDDSARGFLLVTLTIGSVMVAMSLASHTLEDDFAPIWPSLH